MSARGEWEVEMEEGGSGDGDAGRRHGGTITFGWRHCRRIGGWLGWRSGRRRRWRREVDDGEAASLLPAGGGTIGGGARQNRGRVVGRGFGKDGTIEEKLGQR